MGTTAAAPCGWSAGSMRVCTLCPHSHYSRLLGPYQRVTLTSADLTPLRTSWCRRLWRTTVATDPPATPSRVRPAPPPWLRRRLRPALIPSGWPSRTSEALLHSVLTHLHHPRTHTHTHTHTHMSSTLPCECRFELVSPASFAKTVRVGPLTLLFCRHPRSRPRSSPPPSSHHPLLVSCPSHPTFQSRLTT